MSARPALELPPRLARPFRQLRRPPTGTSTLTIAVGGTIHALVGENGAGKSTAMRVAYGFYKADGGEILIDGSAVPIVATPRMMRSRVVSEWSISISCWSGR